MPELVDQGLEPLGGRRVKANGDLSSGSRSSRSRSASFPDDLEASPLGQRDERIPDALRGITVRQFRPHRVEVGDFLACVWEMSKTCTTRKPRMDCKVFSLPSSSSIFVRYLHGAKIAIPFSPFTKRPIDFLF